jgi:hypothetical protein
MEFDSFDIFQMGGWVYTSYIPAGYKTGHIYIYIHTPSLGLGVEEIKKNLGLV